VRQGARRSRGKRNGRCKAFDLFLYLLILFLPMIGAMESSEPAKILPGLEPASPVTIKLADLLNSECTVADIRYGPEEPTPSQKRCIDDIAIETCNSTGWTALRERLLYSHADVLLAQEHWVLSEYIDERKQQALHLGWKSIWAPAIKTCEGECTDNRMTSAGVAIFVRKHFGLTHLEQDGVRIGPLEDGRLVAGLFAALGLGQIVVYAAYLHCGVGLNSLNKDIIGKIRANADQHGMPWLCGADWNFEPDVLASTDLPKLLNARILAPSSPTCLSPSTSNTLDYFLVEKSLASAMKAPCVIIEATTRPHRPVQAAITANLSSALVQKFRDIQRLPTEPVPGPSREPQSFDLASKVVQNARDEFNKGNFAEGRRFFALAFKEWAGKAEIEVAQASDTTLRGRQSRGDKPTKVMKPLLPKSNGIRDPPRLGKLIGVLQSLQGVAAQLSAAWKKGNKCWSDLIACTSRACRYIQSNPEVKTNCELKLRIDDHLNQVLRLAAAGGVQLGQNPDLPWQEYTSINCTAAAIRRDLNGLIKDEVQAPTGTAHKLG